MHLTSILKDYTTFIVAHRTFITVSKMAPASPAVVEGKLVQIINM